MSQITTENLLSMTGSKQVQLEVLQVEYEKLSQRMQSTVECPDPAAHAVKGEDDGSSLD